MYLLSLANEADSGGRKHRAAGQQGLSAMQEIDIRVTDNSTTAPRRSAGLGLGLGHDSEGDPRTSEQRSTT